MEHGDSNQDRDVSPRPPEPVGDPQALGSALGPALQSACGGRLSAITWFRTDWQRGGALTGYATFQTDEGSSNAVVVKVPLPPRERTWLLRLQNAADVVPRVYAHGDELGSYDMAWVVMECLPHGPLGSAWDGQEFDLLVEAAVRFYAAAKAYRIDGEGPDRDWDAMYDRARKHLRRHDLPNEQRWKEALKKAHRTLGQWGRIYRDRPRDDWCHGDLHLANAMTRAEPPQGPAILLDLASVHPGSWVEDAVYFEHLFWARRRRLNGRRLCSQIAAERKKIEALGVDGDWSRLAQALRGLLAMSTPAMLHHDGDPQHVQAALEVLEATVG